LEDKRPCEIISLFFKNVVKDIHHVFYSLLNVISDAVIQSS